MEYILLFSKVYAMNWIEYWREAAFAITAVGAWLGGRKSAAIKLKTEGADSISALQRVYDKYIEHNSLILQEVTNRLSQVEKHGRDLQKNFNDMSIAYANVVSENKRIEEKYNRIVREHEDLKIAHGKLLKDFEEYKKRK